MSKPLILDSLEIRGFRVFRHLRVEHLGRVNLIVGKNGVGKTALLEALRLYAYKGFPRLIWELLVARDESGAFRYGNGDEVGDFIWDIKHLFCGRKDIRESPSSFEIGTIDSVENKLSVTIEWFIETEDGRSTPLQLPLFDKDNSNSSGINDLFPSLIIQRGLEPKRAYQLPRLFPNFRRPRILESKGVSCIFTSANGLEQEQISQLWDDIALTNLEADVLALLRIIAPEIERVNLIGRPEQRTKRIPIVKLAGFDEPVPLRSLGEGMNRMFSIALAMVNSKDGMLLIDEIESGLHYSAQPDLWRLIFQTAHRLNIQVFATSHSWDCIEAFQQAAQESKASEGMLISLRRKKRDPDEIVAVLFNEEDLDIATREQIEIR